MKIGIDLGDVWNHYCTINEEGEVIDRQHASQPKRNSKTPTKATKDEVLTAVTFS
jgi:hypothetical protein